MTLPSLPHPPQDGGEAASARPRTRRELFAALVEAHAGVLHRVARALTGSDAAAQDAVQDAYLDAWQGIDGLREPERARAWLVAILRRRIRSGWRRRASRPFEDAAPLDRDDLADPAPDLFERVDDREALERALESVPEPHREALVLVLLAGLSPAEAAEQIGVPRNTVLSRLHRGRAALRRALSRSMDGGAP